MEKQTMSPVELANYIGVSKDLIYQMVRENRLPYIRVGRRILFRQDTIIRWMNQEEIKSLNQEKRANDN